MIVVDTDVLVAHLRGVPAAHAWLRDARAAGPLTVSAVTVAELVAGMRVTDRQKVFSLVRALRVEPVTEIVARRAGELAREYRRSHPDVSLADYLVAATAETLGARLATLDARRFPMLGGLDEPVVVRAS